MAVTCDCIKIKFFCSDSTTFEFKMTLIEINSIIYGIDIVYLGNYNGITYILFYNGFQWVFANNEYSYLPIFTNSSSTTKPCNIEPEYWTVNDLSNFNYCSGDFDVEPIIIEDNSNDYPNCDLFSGECGCKTIVIDDPLRTCILIYQTCEGQIFYIPYSDIFILSELTICCVGNPIFINIDYDIECGTVVNNNSVTCSNYCSLDNPCCLSFTAITESGPPIIEIIKPAGNINGEVFYNLTINNQTFILYFGLYGEFWGLINITNSTLSTLSNYLEFTDSCPVGEWEYNDGEIITFITEQVECPLPPIPPCLTGQTVNECDVLTILPLGAECQITNPTYTTESDGSITLVITGGTPPYQIFWDNKGVGITIDNLTAGTYTATVVDYYGDFSAKTTCVLTAEQPPVPCKNPIIQILDNIKDDVGLNTEEGINSLDSALNSIPPIQVNNCQKVGNCSPNCQPYMLMNVENAGQVISTFESFCYKFNCCVTFLGDYNAYNDWDKFVDSPIFEETTFQTQCTPSTPFCEGADIVEETNCEGFSDIQDCLNDLGTLLPSGDVDGILQNGIFESGLFSGTSLLCILKEYFDENSVTSSYASRYINIILENGLVIVYGTEPQDECIATVFNTNQYLSTISEVSSYCELCVCYTPNGFLSESQKYDLLNYEINGKPAWSSQTTNTQITWNNITNVWEITPAFYYLGTPTGQIINPTTINNAPNGATWQILSGPPLSLIATTYQTSGGYIQSCSSLCAKVLAIRPA